MQFTDSRNSFGFEEPEYLSVPQTRSPNSSLDLLCVQMTTLKSQIDSLRVDVDKITRDLKDLYTVLDSFDEISSVLNQINGQDK